jgi:hypothetical protein
VKAENFPSPRALRPRLYRTDSDGPQTVFFTSVDREPPLVAGVTVVCSDSSEVRDILTAASFAALGELSAVARRWPDGRRAVVINPGPAAADRQPEEQRP